MGTFRSFHSVEHPEQAVFNLRSGGPAAVAMKLVLALALSSCSGSEATPEAPPSTTPSSPASPTSEPTEPAVVAPTMPPEAQKPGKPGARAQVEHLIALLNHSMLTGETAPLRAVSPRCSGCRAYADLYDETYSNGGLFKSSTWTVKKQLVYRVKDRFYSFADIAVAAGDYVAEQGAKSEHFGPRKYTIRVALARRGDAWLITGLRDAS